MSSCYLCRDCDGAFNSLDELNEHQMICESEPMKVDEELDVVDVASGSDDIAMDEESLTESDGSLRCRMCPVKFDDMVQLTTHYTISHPDRPRYECEECTATFVVKRELATHMRIHSGEQPHKCTQCGKEFGTRQLLKKHWMWHTGERSHVCPHCGKAFFQKGHLTQHLMIHSGGRPHQCKQCHKTFIFKFDLNRHMKIHQERGYSCKQCGKSFVRQIHLDEHAGKCKAKISSPISRTPMTPLKMETPPALPNMLAQYLFLQQQQQQQRAALGSLLNTQSPGSCQPVAPVATPFFCVLCSKPFPNHAMFTLHMYIQHIVNQQSLPSAATPAIEERPNIGSANSSFNTIGINADSHIETATNTSCASSPQKPSPFSSDVTSPPSTSTEASPSPTHHQHCRECATQNLRVQQLESELAAKGEELENYKNIIKTVMGSADALSCTTPNILLASTRNLFNKVQGAL